MEEEFGRQWRAGGMWDCGRARAGGEVRWGPGTYGSTGLLKFAQLKSAAQIQVYPSGCTATALPRGKEKSFPLPHGSAAASPNLH